MDERDKFAELDFQQADQLIRSRQFVSRGPRKSSDLIAKLMARKGYGQQQAARELDEIWNAIADPAWRDQTRVGLIRRGKLEIIVQTSGLHQRLDFERQRLVMELNQKLPRQPIQDIRFRIGNV